MRKIFLLLALAMCAGIPAQSIEVGGQEFVQAFQSGITPFRDFSTPLLEYYELNNRWPTNKDLDDFISLANGANGADFSQYESIDFQTQPDGSLIVKFRLKSNPEKESELSFKQPYQQLEQ